MGEDSTRSLTPELPEYRTAQHFLRILNGVPYALFRSTYNTIFEQRGNPQATVDWTDPDSWAPERLTGEEQALALRIWHESKRELNPRYLWGPWYLCRTHELMEDEQGLLRITKRGQRFLDEPAGQIVAQIDAYEGILVILELLAGSGASKRSELLPGYGAFCQASTNYRSEGVIKKSLYDRLVNLIDRGYVARRGQSYAITDSGIAYLDKHADLVAGPGTGRQESELQRLARELSKQGRAQLSDHLTAMDPYRFEELIGLLLQEMGYTGIQVTSPTNDKGVDVVANFEVGISSVREVVQVKRHKGSIHRHTLDGLRGSLHRFGAMRGTIITTGSFSKGTINAAFEHGAAPITLIDGEKLLDLLIENQIGVKKTSVEYIEFDPSKLAQFGAEDAGDGNGLAAADGDD